MLFSVLPTDRNGDAMQINSISPTLSLSSTPRQRRSSAMPEDTDETSAAASFSVAVTQYQLPTSVQDTSAGQDQRVAATDAENNPGQNNGRNASYSPPGGSQSNASELLRLLGANTEGVSVSASSNGVSTERTSFFQEVLKSFSDQTERQPQSTSFTQYMQNLLHAAYGK